MHITGFTIFLTIVFILISILMIMIILVQRGRGGGLAGAFGGGGGANTAFGTKTGDVFTTVTVIFFALFMLLAIYLNRAYRPADKRTAAVPSGTEQVAPGMPPVSIINPTSAPATGPGSETLPVEKPSTTTTSAPASAPSAPKAQVPAPATAPATPPAGSTPK